MVAFGSTIRTKNMRRFFLVASTLFLLSSGAYAADMPAEPVAVYDWSGFYLGGNAGAAFNSSSVDEHALQGDIPPNLAHDLADKIDSSQTVFTGGGLLGYNWQMDNLVIGAETDFNFLGFDDSTHRTRRIDGFGTFDTNLSLQADWFGTLRGRLGFAVDNVLIYGTGGLAYGNVDAQGRVTSNRTGNFWKGSESSTNWGWTAGGGVEVGLGSNGPSAQRCCTSISVILTSISKIMRLKT